MKELIEELCDLLTKHDAAIVRSADENNKLVICKYIDGVELTYEFEEEITPPIKDLTND